MKPKASRLFAVSQIALCLSARPALAVDRDWDGPLNGDWNTAANWTGDVLPGTLDNVFVRVEGAATKAITLSATPTNSTVNEVGLNRSGNGTATVNQTGGTLNVNSWFNLGQTGGGTGIWNMSGNSVLNATHSAGGYTVIGVTGGSKGELNLSGNAQFKQTAGDFRVGGQDANTGATTGTVTLKDNAQLSVSGISLIGTSGTGIVNQTGGSYTGGSWIVMGRFAGSNGTYNISAGKLDHTDSSSRIYVGENGTGTLNISGTALVQTVGGVRLGNTGGNGTVNLNGGTLITTRVEAGDANATQVFYFNGGTLKAGAANATFISGMDTLQILGGGAIIDSNSYAIGIAQALLAGTGSGGLTKTGAGTLTLSGANTYTGATTISAGTLQFAKATSLYNAGTASWTAANIKIASGATLALNVGGTNEFSAANVTTLLTNLGGVNGTSTAGFAAGSNIAFDTTNASGGTFTVNDTIQNSTGSGGGAIGLTKLGTGTLTLTAANTFTGAVTVNNGTLSATAANSAANGAFKAVSGITVNNGGTLKSSENALFGYDGSMEKAITVNQGGTITADAGVNINVGTVTLAGGTMANGGASATWGSWTFRHAGDKLLVTENSTVSAQNVFMKNGAFIDVAAGKTLDFTGTLTNANSDGTGVVIKQGAGTLTLSNTNTYTGATTVNGGTLSLTGALSSSSALAVGGGGIFSYDMSGTNSQTVAGLTVNSGNATVNNTISGNTLTLGTITRVTGNGVLNFATTTGAITTTKQNTNGIIGPWALFGGTKYAVGSADGSTATTITGLTGTTQELETGWTDGAANYEVSTTTPQTLTGIRTGNTFRYSGTGLSIDLGSAGSNTFTTNGILATGTSGTLTISRTGGTGTVVAGSIGEIVIAGSQTVAISAPISSGTVTYGGTSTLTLSGANSYAGATNVNGGTLQLGANGAMPDATVVTLSSGGTLDLNGRTETVGRLYINSSTMTQAGGSLTTSLVGDSGVSVGNTAGTSGVYNLSSGTLTLSNNGNLNVGTNGTGVFNQTGGEVNASGHIVLGSVGTGSGTYNVSAGALSLANSAYQLTVGAGGRGVLNISGTGTATAAGEVRIGRDDKSNGAVVLSNTGALTAQGGICVGYFGGSTGSLTVSDNASVSCSTLWVRNGTSTITVTGGSVNATSAIQLNANTNGTGVFIQNGGTVTTPVLMTADAGNGTYNLNGGTLAVGSFTKNAGTGKIFFNGGTLKATAGWTLGGGNVSATEVRNGGAIIDSNGKNITISQALVHSTTGGDNTLDGGLTLNDTAVTKGTLTLSGTNTYTGNTTIKAGTLALGSAGTFAKSPLITVGDTGSTGAVLDLSAKSSFAFGTDQTVKGIGTINIGSGKSVTIAGILAPGNSIGTINETGDLILTGTLQTELGTPNALPASGLSDRTAVSGNLTLTGSTLQLIDNAGANSQGSAGAGAYRIATYGGSLTGTFATVTNPLNATLHEKVIYGPASGGGAVDLNLYRLATANTLGTTVNLGNARVGGTLSQAVSVQNTATADGFSEGLNASGGILTGSATTSGSITNLAADSSNNNSLWVGLDTSTAGAKTGTVAIGLQSNGTGTSGYGNTALSGQTVTVNGAVYNPASAATAQTVNLNTRVNASVSTNLSIGNTGAASAPYQETLGTTGFSGTSNHFTATGSATGIAGGSSASGSLSVGMVGNAFAGLYSGSTTLGLQTEEVNGSGLGTLGIASQVVTINVGVYNFAQALLSQTGGDGTLSGLTLDFGSGLALNTTYTAILQFANTAFGDAAFQDTLDGTYSAVSGTGFSSTAGSFTGLAANGVNSFTISFYTGTAGTFTGSIDMTGLSNANGVSGLSNSSLGTQTINFTATVIPEPRAALLGSLGLLMLLRRRR